MKTNNIQIRISTEDKKRWQQQAERSNMDLSEWVRSKVEPHLAAPVKERPPGPDMELIMRQAAEFAAEEREREARESALIPISEFTPEQIAEAEKPEELFPKPSIGKLWP